MSVDEERREIAERHFPTKMARPSRYGDGQGCVRCGEPWPCDAVRLLKDLAQAEAERERLDVERLAKAVEAVAIENRDRVLAGDYSADTYVQHAERLLAALPPRSE